MTAMNEIILTVILAVLVLLRALIAEGGATLRECAREFIRAALAWLIHRDRK